MKCRLRKSKAILFAIVVKRILQVVFGIDTISRHNLTMNSSSYCPGKVDTQIFEALLQSSPVQLSFSEEHFVFSF